MFSWFKPRLPRPGTFRLITANGAAQVILAGLAEHRLKCKPRLGDKMYAMPTKALVKAIANKAWEPWVADLADCDDQALAVKHQANRAALDMGLDLPLAMGFFWTAGPAAHAYTFAIVSEAGKEPELIIYNQTTGFFEDVAEIDHPITLLMM